MLDADATQLLMRAEELAGAGHGEEAAELSESVAQRLLSQGNVLAAAAVFQRAGHQLPAEVFTRERRQRVSESLSGALSELGMASGVPRERRIECLFRAAVRYWSEHPEGGHRGVCFACGQLKPVGWMRCEGCSALPELSEQVAFGLLASERVCSLQRLHEVARRAALGEVPIPHDVQRLFATALYQCSAERDRFVARPAPGTVLGRVAPNRRCAVLLEVSTSAEYVSEKPASAEFLDDICDALLETREASAIEDLELRGGRLTREVKAELVRRFGSNIQFERWRRLEVECGAVAVSQQGGDASRAPESGPHAVRPCGNFAVAAVALSAERDHAALNDLAEQLAGQMLRAHVVEIDVPELLKEPFAMDPSLSVASALDVLCETLGFGVRIDSAVCYVRRPGANYEPPEFPGEAAMHG